MRGEGGGMRDGREGGRKGGVRDRRKGGREVGERERKDSDQGFTQHFEVGGGRTGC